MEADMERTESSLVVIIGPTASGKTALAVELAEQVGGEIICADSRTIYKDMDIGTAKPTRAEQERVPHWGLDLIEPGQLFTAADFKRYATAKIADIRARGKVPFLVGGTGLYVDAVIFDYKFGTQADVEKRLYLERLTLEELHMYCDKNNIVLPKNATNKRYVIRAIERNGQLLQRSDTPIGVSTIVGIATDREILRARIEHRAEQLLTNSVVEEAIRLGEKYGWESEAMTGNIYPLVRAYVQGGLDSEGLKEQFTTLDWKLARRQLTWFRRNPYIIWTTKEDAAPHILSVLATE